MASRRQRAEPIWLWKNEEWGAIFRGEEALVVEPEPYGKVLAEARKLKASAGGAVPEGTRIGRSLLQLFGGAITVLSPGEGDDLVH